MNQPIDSELLSEPDAHGAWEKDYAAAIGTDKQATNRSGIAVKPLYSERDWNPAERAADLGLPGQPPYTRGIHPGMYRSRLWTMRDWTSWMSRLRKRRRLRRLFLNR